MTPNATTPSEAAAKSPHFSKEAITAHLRAVGFRPPAPDEPENTGLKEWALAQGYSWDEDWKLPEPKCGGCGVPINIWDGDDACPDCDDCADCCWDNHGDEPHSVMARRYETDLSWNRGA